MGFSEEAPMARPYRDARISRIYEGTNEINRMIIGGYVLKKSILEEIPINLIFSSGISRRLSLLVRRTLNFFLIVIAALKLICCSIIKLAIDRE